MTENSYIAPKGDYKLIIKDRQSKEEILIIESEDCQELISIASEYDKQKFSFTLLGKDIFLSE